MSPSNSKSSSSKKSVSFGDITIVTFAMTLGDNPAVSQGVPVALAWESENTSTQSLELYEYFRNDSDSHPKRRRGKRLAISMERRARIILQAGFSLSDIAATAMEIEDIKKSRADSLTKTEGWDRIGLLLKKSGKVPKDILSGVFSAGKKMMPKQKSVQAARSA
mmetsp:Transcript_10800/g.30947  ORF Transcript_10800/g.30947 Transcript_10800/m.30947 type:complete len:164 (-) Transcript_10800:305-796(-)|eukprot:CAMPEP_0119546140 /NCGR_PEP_ID=MMETSP1352-20130426/674_1 /TAXON_ID=265584 /ORGANISM="Stauroneis constricta, Strain CCMP1120" /LENGTH=163 /DNA_ID=CAMNT_0007590805 /DNA_START=125 /DNA_END=616 /DNA_ORIENTATION=-